jgi:hypothetical protein
MDESVNGCITRQRCRRRGFAAADGLIMEGSPAG